VLYRPLLEMNGNWSWWGGQNTGQFVQLWQEMHAYFESKGVTNVLWDFSPNGWSGNYTQYYAGPANVDIVAWDAYPPSANDPTYGALVGLGKPILIAETGIGTSNNDAVAP
jgi:mannan endo-1,4-beta-mannosidase